MSQKETTPKEGSTRINKYLAEKQYTSRRGADNLITEGRVFINGKVAKLGDTVIPTDIVEVKNPSTSVTKGMRQYSKKDSSVIENTEIAYFAYNKPINVLTHSAKDEEQDIKQMIGTAVKSTPLPKNIRPEKLFPLGRLDKDSHGLIIVTNDGRITGKLLDPEENHEKEYIVEVSNKLPADFETQMERGVTIEDGNGKRFKTKPCSVRMLSDRKFSIILTEGKKRQIRRMCEALRAQVKNLKRIRIMNIELGKLGENSLRRIKGEELDIFLKDLGVRKL